MSELESRRCYFAINPRHKCWAFVVRGYDHCRHHLTSEEYLRREIEASRERLRLLSDRKTTRTP